MLEDERNQRFERWLGSHKAILFKVARAYPCRKPPLLKRAKLSICRHVGARGERWTVSNMR